MPKNKNKSKKSKAYNSRAEPKSAGTIVVKGSKRRRRPKVSPYMRLVLDPAGGDPVCYPDGYCTRSIARKFTSRVTLNSNPEGKALIATVASDYGAFTKYYSEGSPLEWSAEGIPVWNGLPNTVLYEDFDGWRIVSAIIQASYIGPKGSDQYGRVLIGVDPNADTSESFSYGETSNFASDYTCVPVGTDFELRLTPNDVGATIFKPHSDGGSVTSINSSWNCPFIQIDGAKISSPLYELTAYVNFELKIKPIRAAIYGNDISMLDQKAMDLMSRWYSKLPSVPVSLKRYVDSFADNAYNAAMDYMSNGAGYAAGAITGASIAAMARPRLEL